MTEDQFWTIIDAATDDDFQTTLDRLAARLARLSDTELVEFGTIFDAVHRRAYAWDLWAAGYLIQGGMGDDSFDYFRNWVIAQGRAAFDRALADPDSLADLAWDEEAMESAESYAYVALDEMDRRGLTEPAPGSTPEPEREPAGEPFPEDDDDWFARRFPRISARIDG